MDKIDSMFLTFIKLSLQRHYVYSMLKRRENNRFHVVSTWNTRGVFAGLILVKLPS